jgi:PadR family transcriptional regulator, regulatory protein PadR
MVAFRRPSGQVSTVILTLAAAPTTWRYGYELCQRLDLTAGTLYKVLMRLADRGLLETTWERDLPAGRPPRHLYRLTGPGRVLAGDLAAEPPAPPTRARPVGALGRRPRLEGT